MDVSRELETKDGVTACGLTTTIITFQSRSMTQSLLTNRTLCRRSLIPLPKGISRARGGFSPERE
jgi:hypothetical protein